MDWKELINSPNMSRKALIVFMGIAAVWMVTPDAPADGKPLDPQFISCIQWAIVAISVICLSGLAAQTILDWKWPKVGNGAADELVKKLLPGPIPGGKSIDGPVDPAGGGRAG